MITARFKKYIFIARNGVELHLQGSTQYICVRGSRVILKRIVTFQTVKMWNELTGQKVWITKRIFLEQV